MMNAVAPSRAAQDYEAAYAAHYSQRDLRMALRLYTKLIASHDNTREAVYSRAQIQNIVRAVVPGEELRDAEVQLALSRLEAGSSPDAAPTPVAQPAPELAERPQDNI
jgi:hypothetical protein